MKIFAIGDVHGKIGGYFDLLRDLEKKSGEVRTIQLGDFGFSSEYKQRRKRFDRSQKYDVDRHVFFGGNHDQYPIPEGIGNLGHFGEVPFIENSFFVRGAESIDKNQRTPGHDWWREEELNWKQSNNALEKYVKTEPKYVFSHDAPQSAAETLFPGKQNFESHTGNLLEQMFRAHKPDIWVFGHWHRTVSDTVEGTTFQCLGELETLELNLNSHETH